MTLNLIGFLGLAVIAVASALGLLFSRNAIYSALFLIFNFATVAVFYLILGAPFIALVQVTVYAGAIMVLFLFVIMLMGAEQSGRQHASWWQQSLVLGLGGLMIAEALYLIFTHTGSIPEGSGVAAAFGSPASVGEVLFDKFLVPFEVTSILLLAALIGAIVLSRHAMEK